MPKSWQSAGGRPLLAYRRIIVTRQQSNGTGITCGALFAPDPSTSRSNEQWIGRAKQSKAMIPAKLTMDRPLEKSRATKTSRAALPTTVCASRR
eukprot:scaffold225164_cov25-Prasinocladus_malaysianus.AAC.1